MTPEKNMTITGDQARMLIELMTHQNVGYRGNQLFDAAYMLQQLIAISNVQPAATKSNPSET